MTSFEYQLHPLGPTVLAGPAFFRGDRAMELARFYRDYVESLPDELTTAFFLMTAPPAPFLPEGLHGKPVVVIAACYAGPVGQGEAVVAPVRALKPEVDMMGPMPYTMLQSMFDPFVPHGLLWYAKSDYFDDLSDGLLEEIVRWAATPPAPETLLHLNHFGGTVSRLDGTPFNHRKARFAYSIDGAWTDPSLTERSIRWTREYWEALRPYAARGAYVNFLGDEGHDRVKEAYGPHYERLVAVKRKYDPQNLFRMNQNIPPNP